MPNTEIELKYSIDESRVQPFDVFETLSHVQRLDPFSCTGSEILNLEDVYFDTPEFTLLKYGFRLRRRMENEQILVTLKRHVQSSLVYRERQEWESPLTGATLTEVQAVLRAAGIHVRNILPHDIEHMAAGQSCLDLLPILSIATHRCLRHIQLSDGTCVALLCLDQVSYPGISDETYYDIEVEQQGDAGGWLESVGHALLAVSDQAIRSGGVSKFGRGLHLQRAQR